MPKSKSLEKKIFTVLVFSEKLCSPLASGIFLLIFFYFMGNFLCAVTSPLLTCALIMFSSLNVWYIVFVKMYNKILKCFKIFYC